MKTWLIIFSTTILSITLAKPNGYYHQEYNYQTSSSSYKNHELQHKNDEQGYYSKDGDLEGRFQPKVNAHSQHSEYVNPKLQDGYLGYTGRSQSYGQLHAQNHIRPGPTPFNVPLPTRFGEHSNLRQVTMALQEEIAREMQRAVSEHYQRSSAYSNHLSQAQIEADMRILQEELKRNVTMRLEDALKTRFGNQGVRGAYSYTILNGRLQPTANYHQQELEDLTRQMEAELMRQLQQQIQTQYATRTEIHTHTQHNTGYRPVPSPIQERPIHPSPIEERPLAHYHPRPIPNQPISSSIQGQPIHPNPIEQRLLPHYQPRPVSNYQHQPHYPPPHTLIPDSITTIASRVQTELNEHLNRILENTERRYFSQGSHHVNALNLDQILVQLQQELRTNITAHFDQALKQTYGFSQTKYTLEDVENLRRQIESNLITKLNRDFNRQREKYFERHQVYPVPSNFEYPRPRPMNIHHHQTGDVAMIQRQLQETLSRQLQEALMRQAHGHVYNGNYQATLDRLTAELNRNVTRQFEHLNYQAEGAQLANMRTQLQNDLMRQLQQGLQQSYSHYASWSSSSSSSGNYRPVRGFDQNVYHHNGMDPVANTMDEDCMMGDDPSTYQEKSDDNEDEDLTQQIETEDLTQQEDDHSLTQQVENLDQNHQKLEEKLNQDLEMLEKKLKNLQQEIHDDEDDINPKPSTSATFAQPVPRPYTRYTPTPPRSYHTNPLYRPYEDYNTAPVRDRVRFYENLGTPIGYYPYRPYHHNRHLQHPSQPIGFAPILMPVQQSTEFPPLTLNKPASFTPVGQQPLDLIPETGSQHLSEQTQNSRFENPQLETQKPQVEDLTLTQKPQTPKLYLGQPSQESGFGKLQFGDQKPQTEDLHLTQQIEDSGFGKLQFGDQKPQVGQQTEDFSLSRKPQTSELYLGQQTEDSGFENFQFASQKPQVGQQTEDLTFNQKPQTDDLHLTQQTEDSGFGKLQFGSQNSQLSQHAEDFSLNRKPQTENYRFIHHTGDSGFGQPQLGSQNSHLNQQTEDFTLNEKPQSEHKYLGQQTENSGFGKLQFGNQQTEDITQQIEEENFGKFQQPETENLHLTQQTEDISYGNEDEINTIKPLEQKPQFIGDNSSPIVRKPVPKDNTYGNPEPGVPSNPTNKKPQISQQTEDFLQQEMNHYQMGQQTEDLTQQVERGDFDIINENLTQQVEMENYGQQSKDLTFIQNSEDLTQKVQEPDFENFQLGTERNQNLEQVEQNSDQLLEALRKQVQNNRETTSETIQNVGNQPRQLSPGYQQYQPKLSYAQATSGHHPEVLPQGRSLNKPLNYGNSQQQEDDFETTQELLPVKPIEKQVATEVQEVDENGITEESEDEMLTTTNKPGFWSRLGTSIQNKASRIKAKLG